MLTWLTEEVESRPLALTRILIGGAAFIRAFLAIPILASLTSPATLRAPYVQWSPEPGPVVVATLIVSWIASSVLFTLGWRVTLSGSVLLLSLISSLAIDQQMYANHLYLLAWLVLLLVVADAGANLSIEGTDRAVVRWPLLLLMIQLSIVYGFSAITKINHDFLSGAVLAGSLQDGMVPFPDTLTTPGFLSALALLVFATELAIAVLIWTVTFRPAAFVLGILLHVTIVFFVPSTAELIVFPLEMLALYPLFLESRPLQVRAPAEWAKRTKRFDLLRAIRWIDQDSAEIKLVHHDRSSSGAPAHTRILEHLVPWLWVAPFLRLPVVSWFHRRRHQARTVAASQ